ncbi:MAG TPA: TonB family protein [Thermoanaerobaculia bacterium]|nr:TonB family protein [Thermoanaerobaculia bacterium]
MATRARPYELLGHYILFKRIDSSHLHELWRGAKIEGDRLGELLAIHRFIGGDLEALRNSIEHARPAVPSISGTTVVRLQEYDIVDGSPIVVHEYTPGRTLKHIVDRARSGVGTAVPQPIPIDQALAIVERLALSIETLNNMKYQGARLNHGSLLPQFVWISDDGEVRLAAHLLGPGLLASLRSPDVARELTPWVAPEIRDSLEPSRVSDVYALGAILYLLLTGEEPPDPADPVHFQRAMDDAKLMTGGAIPADVRPILERTLSPDPSGRFSGAGELRQQLAPLLHGGAYTATSFNLAFYLSTLLRKEMEHEAIERRKEESVNLASYSPRRQPLADQPAASPPLSSPQPHRSRFVVGAAVALVVFAAAAGVVIFRMSDSGTPAAPGPAAIETVAAATPVVIEPIVETAEQEPASGPTVMVDPEAEKRAFEDAVNKRLREEMLKLQAEYNELLKKNPSAPPPAPLSARSTEQTAPARTTAAEERPLTTARLEQMRREGLEAAARQPQATATMATPPPPSSATAPAPATPDPVVATVNEGDLIAFNLLDQPPRIVRRVKPVYPPLAARQKVEADVILTALVSDTGAVIDVKILQGDPKKMGLDEAAIQAVRQWQFTPAIKDGRKVKTWMPVGIEFKLR